MQFFWYNYRYKNSIFWGFSYYWAGSLLTTVPYHKLFEIFEKPIVVDPTTEHKYTESRENKVNVSQQLNYNFIVKDV